jgi:fructose/tagatose bisphosphate aldolase
MTLVRTQELLDTAVNSRVGVAAFNVITLERGGNHGRATPTEAA